MHAYSVLMGNKKMEQCEIRAELVQMGFIALEPQTGGAAASEEKDTMCEWFPQPQKLEGRKKKEQFGLLRDVSYLKQF